MRLMGRRYFPEDDGQRENIWQAPDMEFEHHTLQGNGIKDTGAVKLATSVPPECKFKVWLSDNLVSDETQAALNDLVGPARVQF